MKRRIIAKIISIIFICLAILSGICAFGSVGSMELGKITLLQGFLQIVAFSGVAWLFWKVGKVFDVL